jgi:hypothetical protein
MDSTGPNQSAGIIRPLALGILAILLVVGLTGLAWRSPTHPLDTISSTLTTIPTVIPTAETTATPKYIPWTVRLFPEPADPASVTNGLVILAGVIVLIILGATLSATLPKRKGKG